MSLGRPRYLQYTHNHYGSILFPPGFAGNHLRWLLFLDKKFVVNGISANTVEDKLNLIRDKIYHSTRTWYNWLNTEWQYRNALDQYIEISHCNFRWEHTSNKELYLTTTDENLPFHHYFHLNLGFNGHTPEYFQEEMQQWMSEFKVLQSRIHEYANKKIVTCDPLFQPCLSREFYNDVVDFYEFDDNFEAAQKVHEWYYACRERSAKDFVAYISSASFQQRVEFLKNAF